MKLPLFIASVLILFSFNALALDVKQRFDHLDANKNGYLTSNELGAQPQLRNSFETWDKNKDKKISLTEFKSYLTNNLY